MFYSKEIKDIPLSTLARVQSELFAHCVKWHGELFAYGGQGAPITDLEAEVHRRPALGINFGDDHNALYEECPNFIKFIKSLGYGGIEFTIYETGNEGTVLKNQGGSHQTPLGTVGGKMVDGDNDRAMTPIGPVRFAKNLSLLMPVAAVSCHPEDLIFLDIAQDGRDDEREHICRMHEMLMPYAPPAAPDAKIWQPDPNFAPYFKQYEKVRVDRPMIVCDLYPQIRVSDPAVLGQAVSIYMRVRLSEIQRAHRSEQ